MADRLAAAGPDTPGAAPLSMSSAQVIVGIYACILYMEKNNYSTRLHLCQQICIPRVAVRITPTPHGHPQVPNLILPVGAALLLGEPWLHAHSSTSDCTRCLLIHIYANRRSTLVSVRIIYSYTIIHLCIQNNQPLLRQKSPLVPPRVVLLA